ncbi:MAG: helix-turn-helix domain-containing protein [Candidatus Taylorbacteria bacterium]
MNEKDKNIIENSGLSSEQALVYSCLLETGISPAKHLSKKTGLGRALTYKVLEQLIVLRLVEKKKTSGRIALFSPEHPKRLVELLEEKKLDVEQSKALLQTTLTSLSSSFNLLQGKPNVQFLEGVAGLQEIYNDILDVNQNILVISSPIHQGKQEVIHLIKEQVKKQAEQNIKTRAITPRHEGHVAVLPVEEDEKHLITRKMIPTEKLNIPAQIIIYGDKVAITNFKESIITIAIESKYITETFRIMFDYIWGHS